MNAQTIIDTCQKHGSINWKSLREAVQRDREKGARNKEYEEWPCFTQHKHQFLFGSGGAQAVAGFEQPLNKSPDFPSDPVPSKSTRQKK